MAKKIPKKGKINFRKQNSKSECQKRKSIADLEEQKGTSTVMNKVRVLEGDESFVK